LNDAGVEYVVVGGVAAVMHGSALVTKDLDVCAPLQGANLERLWSCLDGIHPKLRMRPDHMALPEHVKNLTNLKNLYLLTDLGILDLLGDVTGLGDYSQVLAQSTREDFGEGIVSRLLSLDALIEAKRAAGRPKDLRHLHELEVIRRNRKNSPQ